MSRFLDTLAERVLVFDGAFGTWVQDQDLGPDDFGGPALEGCNERLVLTRPELIRQMHAEYFEAGVDAVETATFGAFGLVLNEYGIAEETFAINEQAARLAKEVAAGLLHPRPPALRDRVDRTGHPPPVARPDHLRRAARRLRGDGRRPPRRRHRRPPGRDGAGPPPVQGGDHRRPAGDGHRRGRAPDHGAGDGRDHRPPAGRFGDRRRAHRARGAASRRHRAQLRHRARPR